MYLDYMSGHTTYLRKYIWKIKIPLKISLFILRTRAPETPDSLERLLSKTFATTTEASIILATANTLVLVWDVPVFEGQLDIYNLSAKVQHNMHLF
jgi:hypothetical protein